MELEHALDTRLLGGRRTTTTTTTRVLDGCCVPAGVTLESSSSYALARSLAHPDRAGEPRTRPPTEDTPHIDRNLARSDQQFLSRLRTEGKVTPRRCPPRTTRERETHSPNFREFPSVRWTVATAMPIARSGYALLRFSPVANGFHDFRAIGLRSTVIVRIGASIGFLWGYCWLRRSALAIDWISQFWSGTILILSLTFRRRIICIFFVVIVKHFSNIIFSVINVKLEITLKNNLKGKKMRDLIYKEY